MESRICWDELLSNHLRICVFNFFLVGERQHFEVQRADEEWKVLVLSLIVALKDLDDPQQNHVPTSR